MGATLDEAFVLDTEAHVLTIVSFALDDKRRQTYSLALTGEPLRPAASRRWRQRALASR